MAPAAVADTHLYRNLFCANPFLEPAGIVLHGASGRNLIAFALNGKSYSIDAEYISEVVQPLPITALPRTSQNVLGIACLRGEIIAVLNLAWAFGGGLMPVSAGLKLIVLNSDSDHIRIALPADRIGEISRHHNTDPVEQSDTPLLLDPKTLEQALAFN